MTFEMQLAIRHLRSGGWQTVLIMAGVMMGVTLVVFVSGLIYGVQQRFIDTIIGTSPQVSVLPREPVLRIPERIPGTSEDTLIIARVQQRRQTRTDIDRWPALQRELARLPGVRVVSPEVNGQAIATVAGTEIGVRVVGAIPEERDRIVHISDNLLAGQYLGLGPEEIVIDFQLADDLNVWLGDRIRLVSAVGRSDVFRVAGIIDSGQRGFAGITPVYITLRAAQTLFATGSGVTVLALAIDDLFAAERIANEIEASLGMEASSWMSENPVILDAFGAQSAISLLISVFSLLAMGFAIASVLIVSVLKRSREIGILKSMGARRRQILLVFTLEGLGIAIIGTVCGLLVGSGLILAARLIPQPARVPGQAPESLLPGVVEPWILLVAALATIIITVIASILPARQAAALDPVEVIRGG